MFPMLVESPLSFVVLRCSHRSGRTLGPQAQFVSHPAASSAEALAATSGMASIAASGVALDAISESGRAGPLLVARTRLLAHRQATQRLAHQVGVEALVLLASAPITFPALGIRDPIGLYSGDFASTHVRFAMPAFLDVFPNRILDVCSCVVPWRLRGVASRGAGVVFEFWVGIVSNPLLACRLQRYFIRIRSLWDSPSGGVFGSWLSLRTAHWYGFGQWHPPTVHTMCARIKRELPRAHVLTNTLVLAGSAPEAAQRSGFE